MSLQKGRITEKLYIKNQKQRRWFYGVTLIIFIVSTFFCVKVFLQPVQIEEKIQDNMIEQHTAFDYKVEVEPNILHPEGGIIPMEGVIPGKIIKNIQVEFESQINALKDVEISGSVEPTYLITAENQWEREFKAGENEDISNKNIKINDVGKKISIPVPSVISFIDQVEEDTTVYADNYFLIVRPNLIGEITYQGKELPLDTTAELKFAVKNRQIELIGEKEFNIQTPIEISSIVENNINLLGNSIPLSAARIILIILSLLSLASILIMKLGSNKRREGGKEEWVLINKKYKDKIIGVGQKIDIQSKMTIVMKTFKDLYHVAEEREQIILRVESKDDKVSYYVLDGDFAYYYQSKRLEKSKDYSIMTEGV